MNQSVASGVALAAGLVLFGCVTGVFQLRGRRRLAASNYVPSDERGYLSRRYRRRLMTGGLITLIGLMIGGAFLSGMERRADLLGEGRQAQLPENENEKPPVPDGDRQFVKLWGIYWISILILVFCVLGLALIDALATRRYWQTQFQQIREDHQVKLRRDLAVHRQHKEQTRGGLGGNRMGGMAEDADK